ncbi:hypothetical protein RIF29_40819 [Crotalaria pallida]|uniref:Uncharacterized protein n=1 Tax=Crotalaria pallida TaxID=3830 RepID=A0AAN9E997_CROPI
MHLAKGIRVLGAAVAGSYNCILGYEGDRNLSLVDESRPCDQSVINCFGDLSHLRVSFVAVEDRSQSATGWDGHTVV